MRKPKWQAKVFYLVLALAFASGLVVPLAAAPTAVEARGVQIVRVSISSWPSDFAKAGETIMFSANVEGPVSPNDWVWDFGDGNSGKGPNPTHAYFLHYPTTAQTFEVTLTAYWPGGSGTGHASIHVETGLIVEPVTYPYPDYYPYGYFSPSGIDTQTGYNVLTSTAIFYVPDQYYGKVLNWVVSAGGIQVAGGSTGHGWFDMQPGYPTTCEADGDTIMFDWVQVAPADPTNPGEVTVTAYIDIDGDCDYSLEQPLSGIKKWGDIDNTELQVMTYDPYCGEGEDPWTFSSCPGKSEVVWYEGGYRIPLPYDAQYIEGEKQQVGVGFFRERVIGTFDKKPGAGIFEHPANGALVHMYLLDASVPESELAKLPKTEQEAIAGGWSAQELLDKLEELQDDYSPYPEVIGFYDGNPIKLDDTGLHAIHVTKVTTNLDLNGNGVIEDPEEMGLTGNTLMADGEVRVKVILVATYPGDVGEELPVFAEICSWNFWTQQLEKVPQVHWVEEKVVLEKQFGAIYATGGQYMAEFTIAKGEGSLEPIEAGGYNADAHTVWTPLDANGVARCYLFSATPTHVEVSCGLYHMNDGTELINQASFVVFFLKLESITLSNVQGERTGHDSGLWDPILDSGVVDEAGNANGLPAGIYDPTKDWTADQFVGKTLKVWKGEMEEDGSITFIGDLQIREIIGNENEFLFVDKDWDKVPNTPERDVQWYYMIVDPVWNPDTDDLVQELNVSQDALLRVRIKGWFLDMYDLSWRESEVVDLDGDGFPETRLPEGRWVLPDDWPILAGANWQELRPHWDIMDQPNDNIMSEVDKNLNGWETAGDYLEWTLSEAPNKLDKPGDLVAEFPVVGPFSTLDTYTPYIEHPMKLNFKTIIPNGKLNWWDCPMPPAKIIFEIMQGPGFFKDTDKGEVYYQWVETNLNHEGPEGIAYTDPFYWMMIPASPFIPAFILTGGFDWNSWNGQYGPYPFWKIFNAPDGVMPGDEQHPTKVEVYSDNHGEAMVWLNGDWHLDLDEWQVDKYPPFDAYDIPAGTIVGDTIVQATADYPYMRYDLYGVSNPVEKIWTWGKEIKGYSEWVEGSTTEKKVLVFVKDRDGMPAIGERIQWNLTSKNQGMIESYLPGTNGKDILGLGYPAGESWTREPTEDEAAAFEDKFGVPCDYGVAGVIISDTLNSVCDLAIYFEEREGTIIRDVILDFNVGGADIFWEGAGDPAVQLYAGWTNLSWGAQTAPAVADAVAPLGVAFVAIWHYNAATQEWLAYKAGAPDYANDNFQLKFLDAYWVQVTNNIVWNQG
jgi:hypothetical protein